MRVKVPAFLVEQPRLACFALMATASSAFGQTYFLGLFGDRVRTAFALDHSTYGLIYALATLTSAALLLRLGALTDRWSVTRQTVLAVSVLAAGCAVLAGAGHWLMLGLGFLLVRFGGQAMLSHIGMTAAGRYFRQHRGKAVAFAATGYPLSEALLPLVASVAMVLIGWRGTWLAGALLLLVVILPVMLWLGGVAEHPRQYAARSRTTLSGATRGEVLRDKGFYMLLPGALAGPFIVTALLFHQSEIARLKGWSGDAFAMAFAAYGVAHLASLSFAGAVIDRIGAQRSLPLALAPMLAGLLVLAATGAAWTPWVFLALLGFTQGVVNATLGAIWPERYGVTHIGAIRSVAQTLMVVSTALAPIMLGVMLDLGVAVESAVLVMALLTLLGIVLAAHAARRPFRSACVGD